MKAAYPLQPVSSADLRTEDYRDVFTQQMALMHNTLVRAVNSIVNHGVSIERSDVVAFTIYIEAFLETLKLHLQGETEVMFPTLKDVAPPCPSRVKILDLISALYEFVETIRQDASAYSSERLLSLMTSMGDEMVAEFTTEIGALESQRLKELFSEDDLREIMQSTVVWLHERSTPAFFLPFIRSHHDLDTNASWPGMPDEVVEALGALTAGYESSWKFAPFSATTGAAQ